MAGNALRTPRSYGRYVLVGLGLLLLTALLVFLSFRVRDWMLDDAFISFRYAENLAHGHGLVYNLGERVEGYTNFLWTIILSIFHLFGAGTVSVSRILGLALGVLTLLMTWLVTWKPEDSTSLARSLLAPVLLTSSMFFAVWGLSGMEVTMFAFLILLSVLLHSGLRTPHSAFRALLCGLALTLTAMTRPEGLMLAGLCLFLLVTETKKDAAGARSDPAIPAAPAILRFPRFVLLLAGLAILYLPYYIWRFSYYGYPLPNTFYAKVGISVYQIPRGLFYLWDFIKCCPLLLVSAAVGAVALWRKPLTRIAALSSLLFVVYVVAVGGDCMPGFRFFAPVAPLLSLLAADAISWLAGRAKTGTARAALLIGLTLTIAGLNLFTTLSHPAVLASIQQDKVVYYGRIAGEKLRAMARPDAVVATNTAGTIPYYSCLRTIDMLGMNDLHIAHLPTVMGKGRAGHEKADGNYVLSRKPDYIQFCSSWGSYEPFFRGDSEVFASAEFRAHYQFRHYPLEGDLRLALWERKPE